MEKTPEQYQAELMQLYRTVQASAPPAAESTPPPTPEPEPKTEETQPEPAAAAEPPASLPEPPQLETEENTSPEQPAIGWIQVITRCGGNARALPGVSVTITNGTQQQVHLEHVAVTNDSGETEKIPVPVPAASISLDSTSSQKPYSTYNISVYADGFYRQISEEVPVFAGTTSRQIFSMIPLPIDLQEPPKTIVYQNTEPNL